MSITTSRLRTILIALCMLILTTLVTSPADAAKGPVDMGVTMPKEAVAIEGQPHRYRVGAKFQKTLRYFRRYFARQGGARIYPAVVDRRITAWHIANTKDDRKWEGINISLVRGRVEIYIIPRTTEKKPVS